MELVELLEFLVRYAFVSNDQPVADPEETVTGRSEPIHKLLQALME